MRETDMVEKLNVLRCSENKFNDESQQINKIFTLKLEEIESSRFIDEYAGYYFIPDKDDEGNEGKDKDDNCPKSVRQTSYWVENAIMSIKNKDTWDESDVLYILAWKLGWILQKDSEEVADNNRNRDGIMLRKDWDEQKNKYKEFALNVASIRNNYKQGDSDIKDVWNNMISYCNKNKVKGIGVVYLITLLHFISNGEFPIYDRFAMASLVSLKFHLNHGTKICLKELPDKSSDEASSLLEDNQNFYKEYIDLLTSFFGNQWKSKRKIDRALWVYGHFFDVEYKK